MVSLVRKRLEHLPGHSLFVCGVLAEVVLETKPRLDHIENTRTNGEHWFAEDLRGNALTRNPVAVFGQSRTPPQLPLISWKKSVFRICRTF